MVGGCIQRTTQSEGPQKKKKVLQVESFCEGFFFFCCIETRFNHGIRTQFPLSQIQRKTFVHVSTKTIKRDKDRQGKSVRTAELHNKQKQHGSYQRGAPGLLQVTEWRTALSLSLSVCLSLSHTHTPTLCSKCLTHSHQCAPCAPYKRSHSHAFSLLQFRTRQKNSM